MSDCEYLKDCSSDFFDETLIAAPGIAKLYKNRYCFTEKIQCARYTIYKKLGIKKVPNTLFPNQPENAQKIIEAAEG